MGFNWCDCNDPRCTLSHERKTVERLLEKLLGEIRTRWTDTPAGEDREEYCWSTEAEKVVQKWLAAQ